MKKTMTIDYNEYMSLINSKDELRKQMEILKKEVFKKNEELSFIKDNAEEILVIEKTEDGSKIESRRKEKDVISSIVNENMKLMEKLEKTKEKLSELKDEFDLIKYEYEDYLKLNHELKINNFENKIQKLEKRNILQRIINKKQ